MSRERDTFYTTGMQNFGLRDIKTSIEGISGIEAMHMMKKGQFHEGVKSAQNEVEFIHKLFGLAS